MLIHLIDRLGIGQNMNNEDSNIVLRYTNLRLGNILSVFLMLRLILQKHKGT